LDKLHESLNAMNGKGIAGGNESDGSLNPNENFGIVGSVSPQMLAVGLGGNEIEGPPAGGAGKFVGGAFAMRLTRRYQAR
jgi:hypothetical protein